MDSAIASYPATSYSTASYPDYMPGWEFTLFMPCMLMTSAESATNSHVSHVVNKNAIDVLLDAFGDFPENWDGEGASALDVASFRNACSFAIDLPFELPLPEVSVLPSDGCVILDWSSESGLLSVQFFPKGGYAFALNDNEGQVSGMEKNTTVAPMLDMIRRVMFS